MTPTNLNSINNNLRYLKAGDPCQPPVILEERELRATAVDIYSRLLIDRIIVLGSEINENVANTIMAQLIYLNSQDNRKPIQLYINSPGGCVISGLQIYDTMQMIKAPVHTVCTGMAASMAAVLLAGGEPGYRGALPNSSIMIHQPIGGAFGRADDIEIANNRIQFFKNRLYQILSEHTGKDIKRIKRDCSLDYWMTAGEALDYGIVDKEFVGKGLI